MNEKNRLLVLLLSGVFAALSPSQETALQPMNAREFVTRDHPAGVSYGEARKLGPQAASTLAPMLAQVANVRHWANIAATLGYLGDPESSAVLIGFIAGCNHEMGASELKGLLAAIVALGHLARPPAGEAALAYLRALARPDAHPTPGLEMATHGGKQVADEIVRAAIIALGESGRVEATKHLQSLAETDAAAARADRLLDLRNSISLAKRIQVEGPDSVFLLRDKVRGLVLRLHVHGVPYRDARALGPRSIHDLTWILSDSSLGEHWANAVTVLGMIGDPAATPELVGFVRRQKGVVSAQAFSASLLAVQALGHVARSGDPHAMTMLADAAAQQADFLGFSFGRYEGAALREVVARMALQGLGISGRPEALEALRAIQTSATTRSDWSDNVDEAIRLHERVSREGAEKVFSDCCPPKAGPESR